MASHFLSRNLCFLAFLIVGFNHSSTIQYLDLTLPPPGLSVPSGLISAVIEGVDTMMAHVDLSLACTVIFPSGDYVAFSVL